MTWSRSHDAPLSRVAHDSGISPSCPQRWLVVADREDRLTAPAPDGDGPSDADVRELRRRNKLLEQENDVAGGATACFPRDFLPR